MSVLFARGASIPPSDLPPCRQVPDRLRSLWISSDPGHRELAARLCGNCRWWVECAREAVAIGARDGVWAGLDLTTTRGRRAAERIVANSGGAR